MIYVLGCCDNALHDDFTTDVTSVEATELLGQLERATVLSPEWRDLQADIVESRKRHLFAYLCEGVLQLCHIVAMNQNGEVSSLKSFTAEGVRETDKIAMEARLQGLIGLLGMVPRTIDSQIGSDDDESTGEILHS